MLEALKAHNFQCLANATVDFAPLTLLTGANGTGKSAVLRACLALRQSFLYDGFAGGLQLCGELIRLGTPDDVLYEGAQEPGLDMTLKRRDDVRRYFFTRTPDTFVFSRKSSLADPFPEPLAWLGTERARTDSAYRPPTAMQQRYNRPGESGQFVPYLLLSGHGRKSALQSGSAMPGPDGEQADLTARTEAWLARLAHPARIQWRECAGIDALFLTSSSPAGIRPRRIADTGLAHILPVAITVLDAEPGSLVWLEHPDAFLHPRAASALGRFLAMAAAHGVQIVAETHSEHLFNGARLAVREGVLPAVDIALNHFTREYAQTGAPGATRIQRLQLDADGRPDEWPEGFFDQGDHDLSKLL